MIQVFLTLYQVISYVRYLIPIIDTYSLTETIDEIILTMHQTDQR